MVPPECYTHSLFASKAILLLLHQGGVKLNIYQELLHQIM